MNLSKRWRWGTTSLVLVLTMWFKASLAQTSDEEAGRRLFVGACGTCHSMQPGDATPRQGPNLHGVLGRKAASLAGFKYSAALSQAGWTWDEETLDRWITNSQTALPGTTMLYRQADPQRRAMIIRFLKSLSQ